MLAGLEAVVEAAEEPAVEVALGGGVPVMRLRGGGRSVRRRRVMRWRSGETRWLGGGGDLLFLTRRWVTDLDLPLALVMGAA